MLLLGLFLILAEIYVVFLVIFLIVKAIKRKKLPWTVIVANGMSIVLLMWLKYKVQDHEIIFTGSYAYGGNDWGEGLANIGITIENLGIVYLIIITTQIVFVIFFSRESKKLNAGSKDGLSF
jgi:NADH:ubiquinone oxidoreductase subunit 5 (subunit L)/multisubunit Na+/H+ antiporter MnhA subunit